MNGQDDSGLVLHRRDLLGLLPPAPPVLHHDGAGAGDGLRPGELLVQPRPLSRGGHELLCE